MTRVAIIGVGLIGGSLGLRWKAAGFADHVVGCGRNVDNLKTGMARGCIDTYTSSAAEACREADLVVVATPVATTAAIFAEIATVLKPGAVVTDVASVKQQIVVDAQANLLHPERFVPGHPIAGTENSGAAAARVDLYEGRRWVLTPDATTDADALALVQRAVLATGAYTEIMTPDRHDEVFAWVSHVPHVLAFALAGSLHDCEDALMQYGGGGLADFLRIAASDPVMWRDIFTANAGAIVASLRKVQDKIELLADFAEQQDGEALRRTLDDIATATRAARGQ